MIPLAPMQQFIILQTIQVSFKLYLLDYHHLPTLIMNIFLHCTLDLTSRNFIFSTVVFVY